MPIRGNNATLWGKLSGDLLPQLSFVKIKKILPQSDRNLPRAMLAQNSMSNKKPFTTV